MSGDRPARRLTLFDVMVLVAATALGLALGRAIFAEGGAWPEPGQIQTWAIMGPPTCLAAVGAATVLLARSMPPRPRWRRIARQPGAVAAAAVLASMAIGLARGAVFDALLRQSVGVLFAFPARNHWGNAIEFTPVFVLGAWVALALSGRWKSERTWVDRMGRACGLFWIVAYLDTIVSPVLRF